MEKSNCSGVGDAVGVEKAVDVGNGVAVNFIGMGVTSAAAEQAPNRITLTKSVMIA